MTEESAQTSDPLESASDPDGSDRLESEEKADDSDSLERNTVTDDESEPAEPAVADRVVVSYPADLSDWGRFQVEKSSFRAFLTKTRAQAERGDVWEEFVDVGCCGSTLDVPLRVERVDGGARLEESTTIEYEVRDACGIEGSWRVQSEGGPNRA